MSGVYGRDDLGQGPGLVEAIWRHKIAILVVAVLAGFAGYLLSDLLPVTYRATAEVVLVDVDTASGVFAEGRRPADAERRLAKEAQRMTSGPVLDAAAAALGSDAATLANTVNVNSDSESDTIRITGTADAPEPAAERANAVAAAYEEVVRQAGRDDVDRATRELVDARAQLEAKLAELNERLSADPENTADLAEQQATLDQLVQLESRARELAVNAAVVDSGVEYVEAAQPPAEASSPKPLRNAAVLAMLGLLAAAAAAWWADDHRDVIEDVEEPQSLLNAPLLGVIPELSPSRLRRLRRLRDMPIMTRDDALAERLESYQFVATSLEFAMEPEGGRVVLMTSATANEGKTLTAVNTALAFAFAGRRVLLVDADLRKRSLTREARLERAPGLTDFVTRGLPSRLTVHADVFLEGLSLMPAGRSVKAGFFRHDELAEALHRLADDFDVVIIDSPAALHVADATALAVHADAVVAVVSRGVKQSSLTDLRDRLAMGGAAPMGYVYNRAKARQSPYGYGYGGYEQTTTPEPPQQQLSERPIEDSLR